MNRIRLTCLLALLLLPLAACSGDAAPTESARTNRLIRTEFGAAPGGGTLITFNGISIEVGRSVTLSLPVGASLTITSGDGREIVSHHDGKDMLIDGEVLDILDGHLHVGSRDYGPVTTADIVSITSAGVVITTR